MDGELSIKAKFIGDENARGLRKNGIYAVNILKYGGIYYVSEKPSIFFADKQCFSIGYRSASEAKKEWKFLDIL